MREKNQVNAMVKIISDFAMSTIAYFFIGYSVAYGVNFLAGASVISGGEETETFGPQGLTLIKFFSADICRRHSGHYFRWHCRARALCSAIACIGCHIRSGLSGFRRHDLKRQFRYSGLA